MSICIASADPFIESEISSNTDSSSRASREFSSASERTAIVMEDFDDLVDPRQYYYGTWTIQRGKQQESQEKNFDFVESRGLLDGVDPAL